MTGIVIGASLESIYAIKLAKSMGIYTIAIDGNKSAEGLPYADEYYVLNILRTEEVIRICVEKEVDFIIPVPVGSVLSVAGKVNDELGLIGVSSFSAESSVDKWFFHDLLKSNGIRKICAQLIDNNSKKVRKDFNFPAIMKPRFGSGSRDINVFNSFVECNHYLDSTLLAEDYVLEELVSGTEYGIDAFVMDNEVEIVLVRKKLLTDLPIRQAIGYLSIEDAELYSESQRKIQSAIDILQYNNCLFHVDIIKSDDGIFIIEMSGRPSGHRLHNNFTIKATNIDMIEHFIFFQQHKVRKKYQRKIKKMGIFYFDLPEGRVKKIPKFESYSSIIDYECAIRPGQSIIKACDGKEIMPRGYFILEESNEENMLNLRKEILRAFEVEINEKQTQI